MAPGLRVDISYSRRFIIASFYSGCTIVIDITTEANLQKVIKYSTRRNTKRLLSRHDFDQLGPTLVPFPLGQTSCRHMKQKRIAASPITKARRHRRKDSSLPPRSSNNTSTSTNSNTQSSSLNQFHVFQSSIQSKRCKQANKPDPPQIDLHYSMVHQLTALPH